MSHSKKLHGIHRAAIGCSPRAATCQGMTQWTMRFAELDARALSWVALRRGRLLARTMRAVTRTGDTATVASALMLWLAVRPGRMAALVSASTVVALVL